MQKSDFHDWYEIRDDGVYRYGVNLNQNYVLFSSDLVVKIYNTKRFYVHPKYVEAFSKMEMVGFDLIKGLYAKLLNKEYVINTVEILYE